jgi:hypothetical protein
MKPNVITTALALAALGAASASADGKSTVQKNYMIRPPAGWGRIPYQPRLMRVDRSNPGYCPPKNQRKARKARRQRFAAGDKRAFA